MGESLKDDDDDLGRRLREFIFRKINKIQDPANENEKENIKVEIIK